MRRFFCFALLQTALRRRGSRETFKDKKSTSQVNKKKMSVLLTLQKENKALFSTLYRRGLAYLKRKAALIKLKKKTHPEGGNKEITTRGKKIEK